MFFGCRPNELLPSQQPYPSSTSSTPRYAIVRFQIDRPVKAGDTLVKGNGPAGVSIVIFNVTFGMPIGTGVIDADNRFAVSVPPLEPNIRIGVGVDAPDGQDFTPEEFYSDKYKGEGALLVPFIGYFQDTVMVQR